MQLKIEHQHQVQQKKLIKSIESPKAETKKGRSHKKLQPPPPPVEPLQPKFFNQEFDQESTSFRYFTEGLEEIRRETAAELPAAVVEAIMKRKSFSEERVYQAIVNTNLDFVAIHFKDFRYGLKHELNNLFEEIHSEVEAGIWDGRYDVGKRNNYFVFGSREQEHITHITEELVRKNINSFRQEMDLSQGESEVLDVEVSQRGQLEAEKNKKAEEFVKKMQEEQLKNQEITTRYRAEQNDLEVKSVQERKGRDESTKKEKHQMIVRRIERRKEMASAENTHKKEVQNKYIKFISNLKKPMHMEMEEKYEKKVMNDQRQKYKRMKELMDEKKPMTFEDLNQHMEKYDELLFENQQFRKEKWQLKENQMEIIASKRLYRSKFYSIAVTGSPKVDQRQMRTSLIRKQTTFADHVKKNYMPRTDQKKQTELQDLVKRVNHQKINPVTSRSCMEQGNRNLQKLHLLIGELRAKNKLKENVTLESIDTKPRYKDYMEEVKQSKVMKDATSMSIDYALKLDKEDRQVVQLEAMRKEDKARRQEVYLDSAVETLDFNSHMKGKQQVEHDFLESAKAKMAILRKFQLHSTEEAATIQ